MGAACCEQDRECFGSEAVMTTIENLSHMNMKDILLLTRAHACQPIHAHSIPNVSIVKITVCDCMIVFGYSHTYKQAAHINTKSTVVSVHACDFCRHCASPPDKHTPPRLGAPTTCVADGGVHHSDRTVCMGCVQHCSTRHSVQRPRDRGGSESFPSHLTFLVHSLPSHLLCQNDCF